MHKKHNKRAVIILVSILACTQAMSIKSRQESDTNDISDNTESVKKIQKNKGWPFTKVKSDKPWQSPIDLITSKAENRKLPLLEIVEPSMKGHKAKFLNNGYTVEVFMNDDPEKRPQLRGGPLLKDTFYFEQMHFHWGRDDIWGSEHLMDGKSFATEIHMVHWNSKYGTFSNAATKDDGLVVLAAFAEGTNKTDNALLTPLLNLLPNVSKAESYAMLDTSEAIKWGISALTENHQYYTYPGSLTTKPFTENVVFILFPKTISLSNNQLHAFRTIHNSEGGDVVDNKRNLQPLHNRPIVRAINSKSSDQPTTLKPD